ncbi:MAG: hypothetical protein RQ833_07220 [Sphingomonadaceae bacterium]|nr:hypothetical protein [Sphingomonadaceae bacterium]
MLDNLCLLAMHAVLVVLVLRLARDPDREDVAPKKGPANQRFRRRDPDQLT